MADELVTVASFEEPALAHIVQARLEAEGIESFLADEAATGTWGSIGPIGLVKLQVRQKDAQRTEQILQQISHDAEEDGPDEGDD